MPSAPIETIRPAVLGDAEATRALLLTTWRATYDEILGADRVTELTNRWHSIEALRRQIADPDALFLVAESAGAIIGHAMSARRDGVLWLTRLYVAPDRQSRGVGGRLLETAIAGAPSTRLSVESENQRAIDFYHRRGFAVIAEEIEDGRVILTMERSRGVDQLRNSR